MDSSIERKLLAAQQRIVDLEAFVASLRLTIERLKSENAELRGTLFDIDKSRVTWQIKKKEEEKHIQSEANTTLSFVNHARDADIEIKEVQVTSQSSEVWKETEQIMSLMPNFFEIDTTTKPNSTKGDISRYSRRHVALKIMYLGTKFHGFASDASSQRTVESELFRALEKTRLLTEERSDAKYTRCGRTDKGVSANGQVVALFLRSNYKHYENANMSKEGDRIAAAISSRAEELHFSRIKNDGEIDYVGVLNRALPLDIRVLGWCYVPPNFSARFNCLSREYNYFFVNNGLDIEAMKRAAIKFCGEHDFRNFCRMDADNVRSFRRKIMAFDILPCYDIKVDGFELWMFRVEGTAFLWHQVRCMVAVLLMVGQKKECEFVVDDLLDIEKTAEKPQYVMAPESPLVLQSCNFQGLSFQCSTTCYALWSANLGSLGH